MLYYDINYWSLRQSIVNIYSMWKIIWYFEKKWKLYIILTNFYGKVPILSEFYTFCEDNFLSYYNILLYCCLSNNRCGRITPTEKKKSFRLTIRKTGPYCWIPQVIADFVIAEHSQTPVMLICELSCNLSVISASYCVKVCCSTAIVKSSQGCGDFVDFVSVELKLKYYK